MQPAMILRATAGADMPEVGIKQGDTFYMAREGQGRDARFRVVKWDRVRWVCSCGRGACEHKLAVNTFVFEQSQKPRTPGNVIAPHEDESFGIEK